jgi:NAD(P)-dependent dehydrogenase (short-subunit alcohol dehydrogenase family)
VSDSTKIALVTGGNGGIGLETVVGLAHAGMQVVIAARNPEKAAAALDDVRARTGAGDRVTVIPLDLTSFASVRECADEVKNRFDHLDVLVNNAGLVWRKHELTVDGHEVQFQTNHLGHFLLTQQLRPLLDAAGDARVVNVSSLAHRNNPKGLDFDDLDWSRRKYRPFAVYSASKLANVLFTRELARRLEDSGATANAVHPGWVGSDFGRDEYAKGKFGDLVVTIGKPFVKTPAQGAATSLHVALSPAAAGVTGQYWVNSKVKKPSKHARDDDAAVRLWKVSEQYVAD